MLSKVIITFIDYSLLYYCLSDELAYCVLVLKYVRIVNEVLGKQFFILKQVDWDKVAYHDLIFSMR